MHPNIPPPQTVDPEITSLVGRHGRSPEALLPILRELHDRHGTLTHPQLDEVARAVRVPAKRAYGAATFYRLLTPTLQPVRTVRLCDSVVCWLHGAMRCREAVETALAHDPAWEVTRSGCLGLCDRAPAAWVEGRQCGPLTPENVLQLVSGSCGGNVPYSEPRPGETRFLLELAGRINPDSLDEAEAAGVWSGWRQALRGTPEQTVAAVDAAGLRGRGGAGFPTARKWRMVAQAPGPRYVICNADESEPLSFKDRVLLDTNPQAILEGMALAAHAVGAEQGVIYIRGEYEPQAQRMERAIAQAEERGWLGERILGTPFSFRVQVHRGAGAYICGEETALLESLEGKRGEPRTRPPYPASHGWRGRPTLVNNVETLAAVAAIFRRGLDSWQAWGTPPHAGTRLYTALGHLRQPGLFEAPLGLTVRQVIDQFGGGALPDRPLRLALVGGAAGMLIPSAAFDQPLGFPGQSSALPAGTGAVLACDTSVSPVALLRELMHFFEHESCGQCTPCRIGTAEARRTLDTLLAGAGAPADLDRLHQLAQTLCLTSLCGLGVSAAEPMRSALSHFAADFAHSVQPRSASADSSCHVALRSGTNA